MQRIVTSGMVEVEEEEEGVTERGREEVGRLDSIVAVRNVKTTVNSLE
jgi:hypothetical protein